MTNKDRDAMNAFVDHMTKVTMRVVKWSENGQLTGMSSGFLYQPDINYHPIVITAGHGMPVKGAFLETRFVKDGQPLLINGGEFKIFRQGEDIDYAYSKLPIEIIKRDLPKEANAECIIYTHKFIKAKKNEAYGFAVINNHLEFIKSGDKLLLPTYCCTELFLELVKQDEHINYFKPSRQIQEDDYYRGASGSPIADPEGAITSILIGGTEPRELLRAFRLDNIDLPLEKINTEI